MEDLNVLIPFLLKEDNSSLWKTCLQSFKTLGIFVKKPKETIPLINTLLNENSTRTHGLMLLQLFLDQSPRSIVNEHIINWFHLSFKGVTQPSVSEQRSYSYMILSDLLAISTEFPDVRKQVSQVFIPKILDSIIKRLDETSQNFEAILKCLFACLLYYGKSCGNYKDKLEALLAKLLLSEWSVTHHFARCFHMLAQCGPPGAEMVNYRQSWETQHLIIINSLLSTLDNLYCDVDEILGLCDVTIKENKKIYIPSVINASQLQKYHHMSNIFSSLCYVLGRMLLDHFPTFKKIHLEAILGVICRSLGVTCKTLENKTSVSSLALRSQLCDIHLSAIKLFNSLILCTRTNLLPFSPLVIQLFIQMFSFTDVSDWPYCTERPFSSVRCAGYNCLLSWLSICKNCCFSDTHINIIVEAILMDIKCNKKLLNVNVENNNDRSKSDRNITSSEKILLNADTCHSALSCIPFLLRLPLSHPVVKNLQETIINLLFEIQRSLKCNDSFPTPYSNSNCRAQLYSALLALCISPHPQFPPPLHYANILFHGAVCDDSDVGVTQICSHSIAAIAHMLHPSALSFDFHTEIDSQVSHLIIKPDQSNKHSVKATSKRARQALYTTRIVKRVKGNTSESCNEIKAKNDSVLESEEFSVENETPSVDVTNGSNEDNELIDLADSSDESIIIIDTDKDISSDLIKEPSHRSTRSQQQSNPVGSKALEEHSVHEMYVSSEEKKCDKNPRISAKSEVKLDVNSPKKNLSGGSHNKVIDHSKNNFEIIISDVNDTAIKELSRSSPAKIIEKSSNASDVCISEVNSTIVKNILPEQGAEILEVAESSIASSPLRRSKRNCISHLSNTNKVNEDVEDNLNAELIIVQEKEETLNNKVKSINNSSKIEESVESVQRDDTDSLEEGDDDGEMLKSFVDSVPD